MNDNQITTYRFLFPCYDTEQGHWCIFAAQPMGNVYIEGGHSLVAVKARIETLLYSDPNGHLKAAQ